MRVTWRSRSSRARRRCAGVDPGGAGRQRGVQVIQRDDARGRQPRGSFRRLL